MKTITLTEDDIQYLRKSDSKLMRVAIAILLPLFASFLVLIGLINLWLCSNLAGMAGMSMTKLIQGWFAGVDPSAQYSGLHLMALQRWVTGISELAGAGFVALMWMSARQDARRRRRILNAIEEIGR